MARVFTEGFEWNTLSSPAIPTGTVDNASSSGSVAMESSIVRSGAFSLKLTPASGAAGWWDPSISFGTAAGYLRFYVRVTTLPGTARRLLDSINACYRLMLNPDGTLNVVESTLGHSKGTSTIALTNTALWYRIEMFGDGVTNFELRVNGQTEITATLVSGESPPALGLRFGAADTVAATYTAYIDDVALNDTTGANQNTWPGEGKVVLLVPTADSAKGTGWTNDAAGSTNFFDAENNEPPVGIADTTAGSGLHQIRNATSNANSSYDATMTTYTAAGIKATDIVNVVVPVVSTGAPVTTSAKQGTVGVVSNPTIANVALSSTGTAGAFWQGNAAGAWPTGWKWSVGTAAYSPAVTLGTAPVMRLTQVTSSTRIALADAMGIYVDYTPAPSDVLEQSLSRRSTSRRGNRTVRV